MRVLAIVLTVVLGLAAVAGGGPVTVLVFRLVDRSEGRKPRHDAVPGGVESAHGILRGGSTIGMLERAAVFATLVAGWPAGLALVLALKGLGRYPELRGGTNPYIAERFIIGTFVSVLVAAGFAGLALWVAPLR